MNAITLGLPTTVPVEISRASSESSLNSIGAVAPSGRTDRPTTSSPSP
jgi:hypothetical protein